MQVIQMHTIEVKIGPTLDHMVIVSPGAPDGMSGGPWMQENKAVGIQSHSKVEYNKCIFFSSSESVVMATYIHSFSPKLTPQM